MKEYSLSRMQCLMLFLLIVITSCNGQNKTSPPKDSVGKSKPEFSGEVKAYGPVPDPFLAGQVSQYIRRMYQDKNGHLWFGTNGDGVCRFDGRSLTYFTTTEGFGGNAVRGITADESGNLWFATNGGVCFYNLQSGANNPCNNNRCKHDLGKEADLNEHSREIAKSFIRYTEKDGLRSDQVWGILRDRDGNVWFGTEGGVSRFDAAMQIFTHFPIPEADLSDFPHAYPAPKLVNCMMQDKAGNIWFGTNGRGVYRYDGSSLVNISEKEGLCNNFVQCILEDKFGNFWFGTRFGGLCRYDGTVFEKFTTSEGLCSIFVWTLMEDQTGKIWLGTAGGGLCYFDPATQKFTTYSDQDGLSNKYVQSLLEDKNASAGETKIWIGASGGLFRFDGKSIVNVTRIGPWQ